MTVLTIRSHKRFGVCRGIRLHRQCGSALAGLLIELSLEGCRISNINSDLFAFGDSVKIEIEGWRPVCGCVRWHHDGMIGLRLDQPLHNYELVDLVRVCRGQSGLDEVRRA